MAAQGMFRRRFLKTIGLGAAASTMPLPLLTPRGLLGAGKPPNILWIVVEDMSPHMGCYGETTIRTPNIDRLAKDGMLFKRAFVTAPVCSPCRSALITGMYQTSIGAHQHRSSRGSLKINLPGHVRLLPEYFKEAGYYVTNGGKSGSRDATGENKKKIGKTDYNFEWNPDVYDANDWRYRDPGQPFFAQIQLRGGKNRRANVPDPVDPAAVSLPPYYPDHPVLREDWATYLNSVINADMELGEILKRLDDEGIADNTAVFFFTDHGISHARDKQFLYDGGMHIPLIVRYPGSIRAGSMHDGLVSHIDISATSLAVAWIPVPCYMEGRPLFGPEAKPREYVISARDRCDETSDRIRCIRTRRFKYIHNFHPEKPYLQPNRYKDNKAILIAMRKLYIEGKLNPVQARFFGLSRPEEELYDLNADPHEIRNVAGQPEYEDTLHGMRGILDNWIRDTKDQGDVPESEASLRANAEYINRIRKSRR